MMIVAQPDAVRRAPTGSGEKLTWSITMLEPRALVAVTWARIVCPASVPVSVQPAEPAWLLKVEQLPPPLSQRCHLRGDQ